MKGSFIGRPCEFKDCKNKLGIKSARIGYVIDDETYSLRACEYHTSLVQTSPAGTWTITKDRQLKPIPATFFIKKGTP